jgi:hypothetical protein
MEGGASEAEAIMTVWIYIGSSTGACRERGDGRRDPDDFKFVEGSIHALQSPVWRRELTSVRGQRSKNIAANGAMMAVEISSPWAASLTNSHADMDLSFRRC